MLRFYSPGGSSFPRETTAASCNCDIKNRKSESMHIYVKNISTKFHPIPIGNDTALGCLKTVATTRRTKTRSDCKVADL